MAAGTLFRNPHKIIGELLKGGEWWGVCACVCVWGGGGGGGCKGTILQLALSFHPREYKYP